MDIKSKSSILKYASWAFLFTFALSGIFTFFTTGDRFLHRDYFRTMEFQDELNQFAGYLSMFELNEMTVEKAKETVTVTKEDINEHRYRYGNLHDQIANITNQYEFRIQEALATKNEEAANAYTKERDTKIEDITNNFNSDEHVRPKVIKEKEQKIEDYFKKREQYRPEYSRYKEVFTYYFKDNATGKVYTNQKESGKDSLNQNDMLFVTNYTITGDYSQHYGVPGYEELVDSFIPNTTFEGQIGIAKSLPASNSMMVRYDTYKQNQIILLVYSLASIVVLLLCFFLAKRAKTVPVAMEKWRPYYNKLPIDIRAFLLGFTGFLGILYLYIVSENFSYLDVNPFVFGPEIVMCLLIASFFVGLTLVQGKFLVTEFKDWPNVKKQWEKALGNKAWQSLKVLFIRARQNITEAFIVQSAGTQVMVLFAAVFIIGAAAVMVMVDPFFLLFYVLLLIVTGLPIGMLIVKKIGYFNRIVQKTNELAAGTHGEDLPVSGKTVLAALADNMNKLKQGVKQSQSAQAKSERLKTELITNVSHDLRTPLTSIITYTELLKTTELSPEDRTAYLEIIDRKSKRLKVLIDDLFEVSKMASGSIELIKEKVDLNQLLQQALAEYDDSIKESRLQFRVTQAEKPVYALVDGQKLWRVFDNLIGNVLKYSLESSRVYIAIKSVEDHAIITFKNVSKFELSDNADELFERFKRGDTSRHTDGSGLGLAIVKSIIDLHDGDLDIETDGDLFKVIITLRTME